MEQWLMESFTGPPVEVSPKSEEYDVVTRSSSGVVVFLCQSNNSTWPMDAMVGPKASEMRGLKERANHLRWRCNSIIWECHLGIYSGIIEVLKDYHPSS